MEGDFRREAGDGVAVLGLDVGLNVVLALSWSLVHWHLPSSEWEAYRRDLLGKVDVLGELHLALLQRALQVSLLDRVASVGVLVD